MSKPPRDREKVKHAEAAQVTLAAGAAAIGDGGRSLSELGWCDPLQVVQLGATCVATLFGVHLHYCTALCAQQWTLQSFPGPLWCRGSMADGWPCRSAEPEPLAAAPAAQRRLRAPPSTGERTPQAAQGGSPMAALLQQMRATVAEWRSYAAYIRGFEALPSADEVSRAIELCASELDSVADDFEAEEVLRGLERLQQQGLLRGKLAPELLRRERARAIVCRHCGASVAECVRLQRRFQRTGRPGYGHCCGRCVCGALE